MQITIVKNKTGKEMTVQELVNETGACLGWRDNNTKDRHQLIRVNDDSDVIIIRGVLRQGNPRSRIFIIKEFAEKGTFHIFDTAKELYTWMAEE